MRLKHHRQPLPRKGEFVSMKTVCTGTPARRAIIAKPGLKRLTGNRTARVPSGNTTNWLPRPISSTASFTMLRGESFRM